VRGSTFLIITRAKLSSTAPVRASERPAAFSVHLYKVADMSGIRPGKIAKPFGFNYLLLGAPTIISL
jgi:hypothetical protein